MFVQEEKIFAGKVLRLHICAPDGAEWLEEATEDTSVEQLKERCLQQVRRAAARPPSRVPASVPLSLRPGLCPCVRPSVPAARASVPVPQPLPLRPFLHPSVRPSFRPGCGSTPCSRPPLPDPQRLLEAPRRLAERFTLPLPLNFLRWRGDREGSRRGQGLLLPPLCASFALW